MASRVVMPKLSDTMEEGRIIRWLKKEGDTVETGQALAEVETDKATVEMEAYTNGTIRALIAHDGDTIKTGGLIAIIGAPGEDVTALMPAAGGAPEQAAPAVRAAAAPAAPVHAAAPSTSTSTVPTGRALKASPLALRMAVEAGLDLSALQGTGPQGRIIKRDIEQALTGPDVTEKFKTFGYEPFPTTRAQFDQFVKDESKRFGDVIRQANVSLD